MKSRLVFAGLALLAATPCFSQTSTAATQLRSYYFTNRFHEAVALGDSLSRRRPLDSRALAWYVASLGPAGYTARADSLTRKIDTASRDPWLLAARSFSRYYPTTPSRAATAEAVRLARRAFSRAPREADFAWIIGTEMLWTPGFPTRGGAATVAFLDSVMPRLGNPVPLQVLRADALFSYQGFAGPSTAPDTAHTNAAIRAYAEAQRQDSTNFLAFYNGGGRIQRENDKLALALVKHAVELSPRTPGVRYAYWNYLSSERGPTMAEKNAAIAADRARFLALTDSAPWAVEVALNSMRYITKEGDTKALEDYVLAKAPRSQWADNILLARANQWRDSLYAARDSTRPGPKSDSVVVRKRYLDALEAFINKPWSASPSAREQALSALFFEVRQDTTYPADKLIRLVHQVTESNFGAPSFRYGEGARALANRKLELSYAQTLAREGLKHTTRYLSDMPGYFFTSVGEQADALDSQNATLYQQLGWSYFMDGKLSEADKQLTHALELTKKNADIYHDLGRLRIAQGRDDDAELVFAQGMTVRYRGTNPNKQELLGLYEKKHGSIDGWEKYISTLEEKERTARKAKILATRDTAPKLVPGFALKDLNGKLVDSDSIRARTLVVNFWGTWCGPCVAEMPELQQFYEKYRNDPSVAILTISNDKDLNELREWMAKRKLTIPTLFDDGYVAKLAKISAFPTTWFIDRNGKVQFTATGNTGALVDEWSWRLEATKTGPVVTP